MFKRNPAGKQFSMTDPYLHYPQYVREALHNSWAEPFSKTIFSNIDEDRFALLYSDNYSRPNTPVNILVGLLILKELNGWTDEETIAALYFDYRVQYALCISDFDKERICLNTLGNFRSRLYRYAQEHGRDLLAEEVAGITAALVEVTGMDTSLVRQDSMMISANAKKMGRLELIYTVNANMVKVFLEHQPELLPECCRHYGQEKDKADQIYRLKKEEVEPKTKQLLTESLELYRQTPEELKQTEAYRLLERLISEQTDEDHTPKANKDIPASSLQNPHEPEATYRQKGNKSYTGYVLNLAEARDNNKNLSMIIHYELEPNVVSDADLGLNTLEKLKPGQTLVSDGAFYLQELAEKAEEMNIELSFSALNGRPAPEDKLGADRFVIDPETELITKCPSGAAPLSAERDRDKGLYKAKFAKEDCAACSLKENCIIKEQVRNNTITITEKKLSADIYRTRHGTPEHQALADFRAGVEGVPSVLRRVYRVDELPVRGLIRARMWDGFKVMAYNFRSYYSYLKRKRAKTLSLSYFFRLLNRLFRFKLAAACYER